MTTFVLTNEEPESAPFTFKGDCCICAEGTGSVRILREMNGKFTPVTNDSGVPLEFASVDGLAFNGHISCNVGTKYKIHATGEMIVTIQAEK